MMETFHERAAEARANGRPGGNDGAFESDTDDYGDVATFICPDHGIWDIGPHDPTLCPTCRRPMKEVRP